MDEGTSDAMQNVVPVMKQGNSFVPVTVLSEGITLQNDAVMDDALKETSLSENLPSNDDKVLEHGSNMALDRDRVKDKEEGSELDGVEPDVDHSIQQVGADKMEIQMIVDVNGTVDKSAKGDLGHIHGHAEEACEEMDIQENDLVKAVLEAFEARHLLETRPIPVLVKGKEVDLVQLSFQVRACGGYDQVTLWSSISKCLGFGQDCGPLLKLVYVKYLKSIENRRLIASQAVQGLQNVLKRENEGSGKKALMRNRLKTPAVTSSRKLGTEVGTTIDNPGIDISVGSSVDGSESLARVLEWMKRLALNPGDPRKGQGARVSRWSEAWVGKCETLAVRLREVLRKKDELSVYDFLPGQSQDVELERKRRGRGRLKGSGKKARRASS